MQKVVVDSTLKNKITPDTLENTRDPSEYKAAVVKNHNDRYKAMWTIDPAKARVISVRQDSFKPWMAHVVLGEDILDADGKVTAVNQQSAKITRQEFEKKTLVVKRVKGETAYTTWQKVETAAGFEAGGLMPNLTIRPNEFTTVYEINPLDLNYYGQVRVKFEYEEAPVGP